MPGQTTPDPRRPLLIGVGNAWRGDDGVGAYVAGRVRASAGEGVEVVECIGDAPSLLNLWAGRATVVIVDAMQSGRPPGSIARWEPMVSPVSLHGSGHSTHGLGVREALALGAVLAELPERLIVYGIEGTTLDVGAPLSDTVLRAGDAVARAVGRELGLTRRSHRDAGPDNGHSPLASSDDRARVESPDEAPPDLPTDPVAG